MFEIAPQQIMESAAHWDVVADDVARKIRAGLEKWNCVNKPVYVEPGCNAPQGDCELHGEAPFQQGFRDLLLTHLTGQGITTVDEIENDALVVSAKAQVVHHKDKYQTGQKASEVIITAFIKDYNAYLMRRTYVYYINDPDYWHYETPPPIRRIEIHDS
jgi:hypothetical protein